MPNPPDLQFGDFTLNVSERILHRDGLPVALTPKAFDLLTTLVTRAGRLVTKDELLKEVWPDSFVEESNLAYHVFAIRRALGEAADGERFIETVPKSGYRFVGAMTPAGGWPDELDRPPPPIRSRGQRRSTATSTRSLVRVPPCSSAVSVALRLPCGSCIHGRRRARAI